MKRLFRYCSALFLSLSLPVSGWTAGGAVSAVGRVATLHGAPVSGVSVHGSLKTAGEVGKFFSLHLGPVLPDAAGITVDSSGVSPSAQAAALEAVAADSITRPKAHAASRPQRRNAKAKGGDAPSSADGLRKLDAQIREGVSAGAGVSDAAIRRFFSGWERADGTLSPVEGSLNSGRFELLRPAKRNSVRKQTVKIPEVFDGATHVGGQAAAGWITASLSAAFAYGGYEALALVGVWAGVASSAAALTLVPIALGYWSLSGRLGLAMSDYLDEQIDPRDKNGELKKLFNKGWLKKLLFTKAAGPNFKSSALDKLPAHAQKVIDIHEAEHRKGHGELRAYLKQSLSHYGYVWQEVKAWGRSAKGLGGMFKEMAAGEKDVAPLLAPYRKAMNLSRGLLIAKAVINTAVAFSIGAATDAAIAQAALPTGIWLGSIAVLVLAKAVVRKIYMWNSGILRIQLRRDFRIHLFSHLLRLPLSFTDGEDPARIAVRLTQDVTRLTSKNVSIPIQFPHLVIQLALASAFVIYSSWQLSLIILTSIPVLAAMTWLYGRRAKKYSEALMTRQAILTTVGGDILSDMREIRSISGERHVTQRYTRKADRLEAVMLKQIRLSSTFQSVREFLQTFFTEILVLGLGLFSYLSTGAPSIGQVMSLRGYAKDARTSVDGVLDLYAESKSSEGATRRIFQYLKQAVHKDRDDAEEFKPAGGRIIFEKLSYSLPGQAPILREVDLTIEPGERVVLMGGTPRMRQSVLDMVLRLDHPASGSVAVDDQDTESVTLASLQGAMALVQNKPLILSDESIRENLMFGNDRETGESRIRYQIEQMGAGFLFNEERFPNGLDTPIREESLGEVEKQKFALVRAALREPAILLIDGIGAGLPVRDQRDLLESVHKLSEGRTTIMLGVPTDKIVEIDRVIMLKGGRVEDEGRPEDLYHRNALFQKAWPALKT